MQKKLRSCGLCSACCTLLYIKSQPGFSTRLDNDEDISKKAGVPCRYLGPNGCTIYELRPLVCRRFRCDWLQGRKGFAFKDDPLSLGYLSAKNTLFFIKS